MIPTIVRGEDSFFRIKIRKPNGDPYSLSGWTKIALKLRKSTGNSYLELTTDQVPAVAAENAIGAVSFTAVTPGENGNSIVLEFDGEKSVAEVVEDWNTANPENTVSFDYGGDGEYVPSEQTVELEGGRDAYYPLSVVTPEELGFINVVITEEETNQLRTGKRLTAHLIIDKGVHPNGERRKKNIVNAYNVEAAP